MDPRLRHLLGTVRFSHTLFAFALFVWRQDWLKQAQGATSAAPAHHSSSCIRNGGPALRWSHRTNHAKAGMSIHVRFSNDSSTASATAWALAP